MAGPSHWNGLLTRLVTGHRRMFLPNPGGWTPPGEAARFYLPFYQTAPLELLLREHFPDLGPTGRDRPLLLVRTVDVERQQPRVFNSWDGTVTARHLLAGASSPLLFPPVQSDGHCHWGGAFWPQTVLHDTLQALRNGLTPGAAPECCLLIQVDANDSRSEQRPLSALQSSYRLISTIFGHQADSDDAAVELGNRYLQLVADLERESQPVKTVTPLIRRIREEAQRVRRENRRPLRDLRIRRRSPPHEYISRDLDYPPGRIAALIDQGTETAREALATLP